MRSLAAGLVDQVDGLVGQKAIGDIAIGHDRRRDQGSVLDADAVMHLVFLAQAAQDRDRVFDGRLIDQNRLEASFQRGILLDVLAIFVERGRADAMQLAASQHGLEQIAGIHRPFGLAGADDGVQFVDEQDDGALRFLHFFQHGLEPFLEFAAEFGAGDERAHVEGDDLLVLQSFRHVAANDALSQAFDDGGLADAGLADQNGIVLGAPRQHLDDAANFLVAADHRDRAFPVPAYCVRSRPYFSSDS